MDLRDRIKLHPRLNANEWVTNRKKKTVPSNTGAVEAVQQIGYKKQKKTTSQSSECFVSIRKADLYCWTCHKPESDLSCETCPRTYHTKCLQNYTSFVKSKSCAECQTVKEATEVTAPACSSVKELMISAVNLVFDIEGLPEIFHDWDKANKSEKVFRKMDKKTLIQRINAGTYKHPLQMFSDFKWIIHNFQILKQENFLRYADQLKKRFEKEILVMDSCLECYYFKNIDTEVETHFSIKCTRPHKVVYARVRGHPHWPAKCLKILKNQNAVVVYFGTYEIGVVPPRNYFSTDIPPTVPPQKQWYWKGLKELEEYLQRTDQAQSKKSNKSIKRKCEATSSNENPAKKHKLNRSKKARTIGTQTISETRPVSIQGCDENCDLKTEDKLPLNIENKPGLEVIPSHGQICDRCLQQLTKGKEVSLVLEFIFLLCREWKFSWLPGGDCLNNVTNNREDSLGSIADKNTPVDCSLPLLDYANLFLAISSSQPNIPAPPCNMFISEKDYYPRHCKPVASLDASNCLYREKMCSRNSHVSYPDLPPSPIFTGVSENVTGHSNIFQNFQLRTSQSLNEIQSSDGEVVNEAITIQDSVSSSVEINKGDLDDSHNFDKLVEVAQLLLSFATKTPTPACNVLVSEKDCYPADCIPPEPVGLFDHSNGDKTNSVTSSHVNFPEVPTALETNLHGCPPKSAAGQPAACASAKEAVATRSIDVQTALPARPRGKLLNDTSGSDDEVLVVDEVINVRDSPVPMIPGNKSSTTTPGNKYFLPSTSGYNAEDLDAFQRKITIVRDTLLLPLMREISTPSIHLIKKEPGAQNGQSTGTSNSTDPFANAFGTIRNLTAEVKKEIIEEALNSEMH